MAKLGDRHVITISFYAHGTAQEVYDEGNKICNNLINKNDNHASIDTIHLQKFATLGGHKIDLTKLNSQENITEF